MSGKELVKLALATLTSGGVAGVGVAYPVAGAIMAGLHPLVMAVGDHGIDRMMITAESESGLTGQQIAERLAGTEAGVSLLVRGVEAARRAVTEEKLQALGRCLGAGAESGIIDVEILMIDVIDSLESVHIRVLRVLNNNRPFDTDPSQMTSDWALSDIVSADPQLTSEVVELLIGKLVGQGVAVSGVPTYEALGKGGAYRITNLGRQLLGRIGDPN